MQKYDTYLIGKYCCNSSYLHNTTITYRKDTATYFFYSISFADLFTKISIFNTCNSKSKRIKLVQKHVTKLFTNMKGVKYVKTKVWYFENFLFVCKSKQMVFAIYFVYKKSYAKHLHKNIAYLQQYDSATYALLRSGSEPKN